MIGEDLYKGTRLLEGLVFIVMEHYACLGKNDLCRGGVSLWNGWVCVVKAKMKFCIFSSFFFSFSLAHFDTFVA